MTIVNGSLPFSQNYMKIHQDPTGKCTYLTLPQEIQRISRQMRPPLPHEIQRISRQMRPPLCHMDFTWDLRQRDSGSRQEAL